MLHGEGGVSNQPKMFNVLFEWPLIIIVIISIIIFVTTITITIVMVMVIFIDIFVCGGGGQWCSDKFRQWGCCLSFLPIISIIVIFFVWEKFRNTITSR